MKRVGKKGFDPRGALARAHWEGPQLRMTEQPKPKVPFVAIGIPTHRPSPADFGMCLGTLLGNTRTVPVMLVNAKSTYVDQGRTQCWELAKERRALELSKGGNPVSHLLFLDDDMTFPPHTLLKLLNHDRDIVGCMYSARHPPFNNIGCPLDPNVTRASNGLLEMRILPTGVLLIRMEVMDRIEAYLGDKGPVWGYDWIPEKRHYMREDVRFCKLAREIGFQLWCDVGLSHEIGHIGEAVYRVQEDTKEDARAVGMNPSYRAAAV